MKKIIITCAGGYIGLLLTPYLANKNYKIVSDIRFHSGIFKIK
tara:strand:+ start:310 stop:438 length:129 start_codon:yes stop_codon:yes gene_type:complete